MNELELLNQITEKGGFSWSLMQWWVSICIAVVIASYLGAEKLTRKNTIVIVIMYVLATINILINLITASSYVADVYEALRLLSETTQLSPIGVGVLSRQGQTVFLQPVFFIATFVFTIGFVIYAYRHVRKSVE